MWILVVGNVVDGLHFIGPFHSLDTANDHADGFYSGEDWVIADLIQPRGPVEREMGR